MENKKFKCMRTREVLSDFAGVVRAMGRGMTNGLDEAELAAFLLGQGADDVVRIPIATHSIGGRKWKLEEGKTERDVLYFSDDCFRGGWFLFREEDVDELEVSSGTSGSAIKAEKLVEGKWMVTLTVPIENGSLYRGELLELLLQGVPGRPRTGRGGSARGVIRERTTSKRRSGETYCAFLVASFAYVRYSL